MSFFVKMNEEVLNTSMILYMRRTGAYGNDNYALMDKFKDWLKVHNLYNDTVVIMAIALDNPNITEPQNCRYDVCMLPPKDTKIHYDEVNMRQMDGGNYVTFLIQHTPEAVQRAWMEYFTELQKHGYSQDTSKPIIERYTKKLVDHHLCELCVPIL